MTTLLLCATVLAACGGARGGGGGSDTAAGQCGGPAPEEGEYLIRVAHELTPQSVKGKAIEKFKEALESSSDGRIQVEIYPNAELYGGEEAIQAVQNGSVEMTVGSSGDFVSVAPSLAVMALPFLVEDYDELAELTSPEHPVGDLLRNNEELEENSIQVVGVYGSGLKQVSTNTKTEKLADFKGQRIRTQQDPVEMAIFKALGANPVPMGDFSQVYTALEQGVIDGQTNPYSTILSESIDEVQDYIAEVDMGYTAYLFIMNSDFYDCLPDDVVEEVNQAGDEMQAYSLELQKEDNAKAKEEIAEGGTTIMEFDPAERLELKQAVVPEVYEQFTEEIGADIVQSLIEEEQAQIEELRQQVK
jgi:C4-dicarboxylate-binding protein DctP